VQFKLVQNNPRKRADHLLTIVPQNDAAAREHAFATAAEFLSALAWQNNAQVTLWEGGRRSWPAAYGLKEAEPSIHTFPRIPFGGSMIGYDLTTIPLIENAAQRIALALFREARASNNDFLSFLFFWQVLETNGGDPVGIINKTLRKQRNRL
jgi:hypothetical protein